MNISSPSCSKQTLSIAANIDMPNAGPAKSRTKTAQQRRLLFEIWEQTGNVREACRQAEVSLRTFYYWKPRFEEGGYPALEVTRSHAPKNPNRISKEIETQIVELKRQNPEWGKMRIAKNISQAQARGDGEDSVSPNTVRRVLVEAGLWPSAN